MDKKVFVLKVLDIIKDKRPIAPQIKNLIETNTLDDAAIDALVKIFHDAAQSIENMHAKDVLQKSATFVSTLHQQEAIEHEKDIADLKELENIFKNIQ